MKNIKCSREELNLLFTLSGGQCFRWSKTDDDKWIGVFAHKVWRLHQDDNYLFYETIDSDDGSLEKDIKITASGKKAHKTLDIDDESLLRQYFRLDDLNLREAYEQWALKDMHFKETAMSFPGVRILNQDPIENVFSFICSSNNNISRISSMVEKMCTLFGEKLESVNGNTFHDFPVLSSLADESVEKQLRAAGFGYRARFICQSAAKLIELGGRKWLETLKTLPYDKARNELTSLPGVGTKVADCICLMSLGHLGAVPVDTHIFQVAAKWYMPQLRTCKSVTPRIHQEIGDFFRDLYGDYAGWAHTVLFCSSLKTFMSQNNTNQPKGRKRKEVGES